MRLNKKIKTYFLKDLGVAATRKLDVRNRLGLEKNSKSCQNSFVVIRVTLKVNLS